MPSPVTSIPPRVFGHRAVEEITALASPRAYDRLRTLETVLQPYDSTPAISEVRGQIRAALVTA